MSLHYLVKLSVRVL